MRKGKKDETYTVKITGEQIKTIRSLYLRAEMMYTHNGVAELIDQGGDVGRIPLYECHFCHKGSYVSKGEIPHAKDCIILLADREFEALNAQFIEVLSDEDKKAGQA